MKILIFTQKVDREDPVLGFFQRWIEVFAERFEKVTVVCLEKGEHTLPDDICVLSLGKEEKASRWQYIRRFYRYIWQYRKDYDVVFVHMNVEYMLLGGLFWRLWGKKSALWFAHKKGTWLRVVALWFSHRVFSISKESFVNHKSKKFRAMGHGIDTNVFRPVAALMDESCFDVVTVGRLSPVKRCEVAIAAVAAVAEKRGKDSIRLTFIGDAGTPAQEKYVTGLRQQAEEAGITDRVVFAGSLSNHKILPKLCASDAFVSMQQIGGVGKATLEAMAATVPTIVCTPALNTYLGEAKEYCVYDGGEKDLAARLMMWMDIDSDKKQQYKTLMREIVVNHNNLHVLVGRIAKEFEEVCAG